MTTTTKTADFMGRALITPDTDARDYVNRPAIAGDRDYMGRLLGDVAGGGGDASALLDEAAVRFDFSQYDDINDMVDVNGGVGPLFVQIAGAPSTAFNADGLAVTSAIPNTDTLFLTYGEEELELDTPLVFGPDGMTVVDVVKYTTVAADAQLSRVRLVADAHDEQYPELAWNLTTSPDLPYGDQVTASLYDTPDTYDTIFENTWTRDVVTPAATAGIFIIIGVVDVVGGEALWTEITPVGRFDLPVPFDKTPPDFAASPRMVNMIDIRAMPPNADQTITRVEWLAWNRALTPAEVDTLVAHFTA